MSDVGLLIDSRFLRHLTGEGHPERPARIDAIHNALIEGRLMDLCMPITPVPISLNRILTIHERSYVERLEHACKSGAAYIDVPDSAICPQSYEIARLAAGGVLAACDAIAAGEVRRVFAAVRPPGHHCERDRSMGFCLLNNIALAARHFQQAHGIDRVAVLDWDVHHGNGTQHIFEDDPSVLFVSIHGHPDYLYPGTGYETESGVGDGAGYTLNVPMMPESNDEDYRNAFETLILPKLRAFEPQVLLISCGFDAHFLDPLGNIALTDAAFEWMTRKAIDIAIQHCDGRILSVLEGGYDLSVLKRCTRTQVSLLMEH
jgi:acetoin utilization deacetylase AcuC-like enzyme